MTNLRIEIAVFNLGNKFPDLLLPLRSIQFVEQREEETACGLSTDGIHIFYDESYLEQISIERLEEEIVHIILHGLLHHFDMRQIYPNKGVIDGVMDIQVNLLMDMMGLLEEYEQDSLKYVWNNVCNGKADASLYSLLEQKYYIGYWVEELCFDNHNVWERNDEPEAVSAFWNQMSECITEGEAAEKDSEDLESKFQNLASKFGKGGGEIDTGRSVLLFDCETLSYEEIWKKLMCQAEVVREEVDSIDTMLYHYGMELYGNVPIIEPKEVNDSYDMKTLVLAIDTSGSCADKETMNRFWQNTYTILEELKSAGANGEIIILECDDEIRKEQLIELSTLQEEWPLEKEIHGMGGTDFRPVFEKIEEYKEVGKDVSGLIYFTDGCGSFPEEEPDYPVYFILTEWIGMVAQRIPDWIQKINFANK